ncbi:MAG: FtsX-like permease family protein, partial [Bacteroidales bacterium]|nr:FtsX-like permease family protein [Bacteroidales bacterium]
GLLILLFESISLIGSLKAFGMTHAGIRKIFVKLSSRIVLKGLLIGNLSAIVLCLIQQHFHVIPLDPVNYFVSYVPVHLNFMPILLADVVAYAAILLLMQIPCAFISRIDPAQTMRME